MTLNLIDKNLKSKYAEALYKNESSKEKIMEKQNQRLKIEFMRSNQVIDSTKTLFLNSVRQKRNKWIEGDQKFRDNYKILCNKVHKKKLENLIQAYDKRHLHKLDTKSRQTFEQLQQQLNMAKSTSKNNNNNKSSSGFESNSLEQFRLPSIVNNNNNNKNESKNNLNKSSSTTNLAAQQKRDGGERFPKASVNRLVIDDDGHRSLADIAAVAAENDTNKEEEQDANDDEQERIGKQKMSLVNNKRVVGVSTTTTRLPKLPTRKSYHHTSMNSLDNDLYTKYTICDKLFLDSIPAKIELTVTDVGKTYLSNKKHEYITRKRLKQNFSILQENAVNDSRFSNLIGSLDSVKR